MVKHLSIVVSERYSQNQKHMFLIPDQSINYHYSAYCMAINNIMYSISLANSKSIAIGV